MVGTTIDVLSRADELRHEDIKFFDQDKSKNSSAPSEISSITNFSNSRLRNGGGHISLHYRSLQLVGRDKEQKVLDATLNRVSEGKSECVFIRGESGSGKSILAEGLREYAVTQRECYFIKGKFDQSFQREPYSALSEAFTDLIDIAEQSDDLNRSKREELNKRLIEDTISSCSLLGRVITNLDHLTGVPINIAPSQVTVSPDDFLLLQSSFQRFVRIFASVTRPIILVLDDIQWADPGSLELLKALLKDTQSKRVLILCTFREEQLSFRDFRTHLFYGLKRKIESKTICLSNLELDDVHSMISSLLSNAKQQEEIHSLSELVHKRTLGNPYFCIEFLDSLIAQRFLNLETLEISLAHIQNHTTCTPNVLSLLLQQKIQQIPFECRRVLEIASCLGHVIDHGLLFTIMNHIDNGDETRRTQTGEGSSDGNTANLESLRIAAEVGLIEPTGTEGVSKFSHDKVQSAFEMNLRSGEKQIHQQLHLRIGRCLLSKLESEQSAETGHLLLLATNQMNRGSELITSENEKISLVQLNLQAAEHTASKSAFSTAVEFLRFAAEILSSNDGCETHWKDNYNLSIRLYDRLCEMEFHCHNLDQSEEAARIVLKNATSQMDKYSAYRYIVQILDNRGDTDGAVEFGTEILTKVFSLRFGLSPVTKLINLDYRENRRLLKKRTDEEILGGKEMTNSKLLATMKMLRVVANITPQNPLDHVIIWKCNDRMVLLSLLHGVCSESAAAFATFGISLAFMKNVKGAHRMGVLAMGVLDRFKNERSGRAKAIMQAQIGCFHHFEPIHKTINVLLQAYQEGAVVDETKFMVKCAGWGMNISIATGVHIPTLEDKFRSLGTGLAQLYKDQSFAMMIYPQWQYTLNMIDDNVESPTVLTGEAMVEDEFLKQAKNFPTFGGLSIYLGLKVQLAVHFADFLNPKLSEYINAVVKHQKVDVHFHWHICIYQFRLFAGIALCQMAKISPYRMKYKLAFLKVLRQIRKQSRQGNPNAIPILHLLRAVYLSTKRHRSNGSHELILYLFSKAISLGSECRFFTLVGLAYEYGAYYAQSIGDEEKAREYIRGAIAVFRDEMGAFGLVQHLEMKFAYSSGTGTPSGLCELEEQSFKPLSWIRPESDFSTRDRPQSELSTWRQQK